MSAPHYLKQNVQVEPLIDRWYAWSHLIAPATAARNITERHLKTMDSYINAPQVHAAAVRNPKMRGGPFIDHGGKRVDEIRALREQTARERPHLLRLSQAIAELDELLRTHPRGYSLHPLYEKVPESLKGYVELVYDLQQNPSFRLLEPLLYASDFYDRSMQSLMLSLIAEGEGDDRPFILSTPRLDTPGSVHLRVPYESPEVDALFRLIRVPRPLEEILELFALDGDQRETFATFFTTDAPRAYEPYRGPGVRWRYFGHACILIEAHGVTMLLDPVLSYTYGSAISRYTYADLPDAIDYVLITHNHQDHILFETMLQIRPRVRNIIIPRGGGGALQDPSLKLVLERTGFRNVIELGEMEHLDLGDISIHGLPFIGEHGDLDIMTKLGYLVRIGSRSLMFVADSCNIEPRVYQHVRRATGGADALFIGMECDGAPLSWLYGPLMTRPVDRRMDESRRLNGSNFEQARPFIDIFGCSQVYVYAMGQEPWVSHISSLRYTPESRPIVESNRLIEHCHARGIAAERLFGEKEILLP